MNQTIVDKCGPFLVGFEFVIIRKFAVEYIYQAKFITQFLGIRLSYTLFVPVSNGEDDNDSMETEIETKEKSNTIVTNNKIDIDTDLDIEKEVKEVEIREVEIEALRVARVDINRDISETQRTIDNTSNGTTLQDAEEEIVKLQKLQ